ncbi:MAG: uridine phosphorylase [Clostridia bacterium]|nr:uridine phosphorylase [Clostridia bacterium]
MSTVYSPEEEFHLKIRTGDVGRYVLLCGDPARCSKIAALFDSSAFVQSNREYTIYTGTLEGEKVSVCSTGIGGPSTAIAVEELIHCGSDTFIRVGTAGGMAPEVLGGDVVIGTGAIRMEGTSREYAPAEYPAVADFSIVSSLADAAREAGVRYHVGVLHNKDNFYGQHSPDTMPVREELKAKWKAFLDCGALASEMESAALFIVCAVRRARAGSLMQVFANQTRREMGLEDPMVLDTDAAVRVGVLGLRKLIQRDRAAAE